MLPQFANVPRNLTDRLPCTSLAPERISIGDDVWFGPGSLLRRIGHLRRLPSWPGSNPQTYEQPFERGVAIGNRVTATGNLTLAAHETIGVEDDVIFAADVNVTDSIHGSQRVDEPYKHQPIFRIAPIVCKRGCRINQDAVVFSCVTVDEFSIIGATSVVMKNVPGCYSAVGVPN